MKATGLSRVAKDLIVAEIEKEFKAHASFFIAQHPAVEAASMDKLRARLRQSDSRYVVVKNSLGRRAMEKASLKDLAGNLDGACGIVFTGGDAVLSSKALVDFAKENESFKVIIGYMDGKTVTAAEIKTLASLPSREVLIARAAGAVRAPLARMVGVLAGTMRKAVLVLDAIAKKKGSGS
ncbi:MAG: 50S ribosomal protein L10 [Candidatus Omnitrophica bacterium]|nr:50S ribosomal protein L10 [Candidatus Omnitrophota bacterium]